MSAPKVFATPQPQSEILICVDPTANNNILVVEDHVDTAEALAWFLTKWGYAATVVHTGEAALEAASRQSFALVASDIGLPDMNGYDLMSRLKTSFGLTGVALTGYNEEEDVGRATAAGFVEHLVKPVDPERLRSVLHRLLPRK